VTAAVLVGLAAALVVFGYFVVTAVRPNWTPPEVRGDWWTRFEREFRDYASTAARDGPAT
jgi:hypothetical protein